MADDSDPQRSFVLRKNDREKGLVEEQVLQQVVAQSRSLWFQRLEGSGGRLEQVWQLGEVRDEIVQRQEQQVR